MPKKEGLSLFSRDDKGRVQEHTHQSMVVTGEKPLENHTRRILRRVGFAKGAWINAGKAVGGRLRGAPRWTTRHRKAPGTATVQGLPKPSVTLINRLSYAGDATTWKTIPLALQNASRRLAKALAESARRAAEKTARTMKRVA